LEQEQPGGADEAERDIDLKVAGGLLPEKRRADADGTAAELEEVEEEERGDTDGRGGEGGPGGEEGEVHGANGKLRRCCAPGWVLWDL
jgi:hypothetical protein